MKKYGFIGCGNMGGALIRAAAKAVGASALLLADKMTEKAAELAAELGAESGDVTAVAESCHMIFLGVKPQNMKEMTAEIAPVLAARKDRFVLVTMAAGLTAETIRGFIGADYPIVRIMPNLPASVGEGMMMWTAYDTEAAENEEFCMLMSKSGKLLQVPENLIDAGSAVSGCGPAFVCMFVEALADGGVSCGLKRSDAVLLACQTLIGTAKTLLETGMHPGALKDAVCSPGGTTIAGVLTLEQEGFRAAAADAVVAAYEKTLALKNAK